MIEASWWRKWCDYVNFTQDQSTKQYRLENIQQPLSLVDPTTTPLDVFGGGYEDNDYCSELKTLTNTDNEQSVLFYEKPGRILN